MDSEDDKPLSSQPTPPHRGHVANGKSKVVESDLSEEDEMPLSQTTAARAPKQEHVSPIVRPGKRRRAPYAESSSDGEDDVPLAASSPPKAKSAAVAMPGAIKATTVPTKETNGNGKAKINTSKELVSNGTKSKPKGRPAKKKVKKEDDNADEDDDEYEEAKEPPAAARKKRKVKSEESDADDEKPPAKKKTPAPRKPRASKVKKEEDDDGDDNDNNSDSTPAPKKKAAARDKKPPTAAKLKKEEEAAAKRALREQAKQAKKKEEEAEAQEVFRWWEAGDANGDGSVKWHTLEHNGVIFPPMYEPLPQNIKMRYNGSPLDLPPESEEVAGFYAAMIETDHARDVVFNKNFFDDWRGVLEKYPPRDGTIVNDFTLCDFRPIFEHFEADKARKKAMTAAEKKELKKTRDELEAPYTTCLLDGRKEKVGNFRVEPPGLFRGRGEHPKKGALKHRVRPEDITLNIGDKATVPTPNMPGQWKAVQHDNTVTWLANWTENVNGNHKYVFLAAGSSLKGQSDMIKFEKARQLKQHVDSIRRDYNEELKSKVMADRQRATAMYFIDKLALRAGNEKGEDEADTVGCCSLRCEHVTLAPPDLIVFDFLGKDSIRYYKEVPVDAQVFKNIRIFKEGKEDDDNLFDRVSTASLNKHLTSYMKGLTAKVFRTYNASQTFQVLLDEPMDENASVQEKLNAYNKANRLVAILCNHQRSAPKGHDSSIGKLLYKVRGLKYERMKLRHALFKADKSYLKNKKYTDDESDVDDDFIATFEADSKVSAIEKANKKFVKDNEKRVEDGKEVLEDSVLAARLKDIEDEFERLEKERGTKRAGAFFGSGGGAGGGAGKKEWGVEKMEEAADKLEMKIKTFKLQLEDRDAGKEVALGTSKINYLDPRITAAWCKIHDVPIEKIFSKTLLTKFPWALEVEQDWKF